jgi:hypothetical protein
MRTLHLILSLVCSGAILFADTASPLKSVELFSIEQISGDGKVEFKLNEQTEVIEFGKDKSHYGLGLVFTQKNLPDSYKKSIGNFQVIQIALGNRGTASSELIPQFGALTLKVSKIPTLRPIKIKIQDTQKADKQKEESGFIVFNSSQMKLNNDDQEKLKNTFFSESGEINLSPVGNAERILVKSEGKSLSFRRQMMSLSIQAEVGNPFNTGRGKLSGSVQFPVYWATEKGSENLVSELAQKSLDRNPEIIPPEEAPRTIASPDDSRRAPKR